jgi:hypothetical protein
MLRLSNPKQALQEAFFSLTSYPSGYALLILPYERNYFKIHPEIFEPFLYSGILSKEEDSRHMPESKETRENADINFSKKLFKIANFRMKTGRNRKASGFDLIEKIVQIETQD